VLPTQHQFVLDYIYVKGHCSNMRVAKTGNRIIVCVVGWYICVKITREESVYKKLFPEIL